MSGQVVHFEIPADDVARAAGFYREAFGWQLNPVPQMPYTMIHTTETDEQGRPTRPGAINGGMLQRQDPITRPVITIDVTDLEAALERVTELGGTVVRGRDAVGDMGFAAYITDTEGNLIGLWQSASG